MKKVLLIEDNELNRDMLSRRLRRHGYTVSMAVNGEEGIREAKSQKPDLILMDLSLPIIDGWEATKRLRADPLTQHIPIIALTAHSLEEDKEKALEAGCDDYDTKPVNLDRLLDKMAKTLQ